MVHLHKQEADNEVLSVKSGMILSVHSVSWTECLTLNSRLQHYTVVLNYVADFSL